MKCTHENDITYGKLINISDTVHVVQILCVACGEVGTQIEYRDEDDHLQPEEEMWHESTDYYNAEMAKGIKIGGYPA